MARNKAKKKAPLKVAVFDFETDPFEHGCEIRPFAAGFYDGERYLDFWGADCVEQMLAFLETEEPLMLYAHNGGKFDFMLMVDRLSNPIKIINGRIVQAALKQHTLRDSFAIIPQALGSFDKGEIDYRLMHHTRREANRADILEYLARDCESLYKLVSAFNERFGPKLTIASTAMTALKKVQPVQQFGPGHDEIFRQFYFGGRCQFFAQGVIRSRRHWKVYDVNSMYPHVMRDFDHPKGSQYVWTRNLDNALASARPFFAHIEATNDQALPSRDPRTGGLTFGTAHGEFFATGHELRASLLTGRVRVLRVHGVWVCAESQRFSEFVDHWIDQKIQAEIAGDKTGRVFAKLILNSSYGKWAQNPADFKDWHIRRAGDPWPRDMELYEDGGSYEIWRKPNPSTWGFYDVAVAASITSASRAVLLHALESARRPVYCDTDSIIAEDLPLDLHPTRLGAWKTEAKGTRIAIAGKKLYALFNGREPVKWASKGVRVAPEIIEKVAKGETYLWRKESPTLKLSGEQLFLSRQIQKSEILAKPF